MYKVGDVWIRPGPGGKGRKMTGTLEAHANGFRWGPASRGGGVEGGALGGGEVEEEKL